MRTVLAVTLSVCLYTFADDRNLSQYDAIGPFTIQSVSSNREADRLNGQVREFLWTHWRQHQRGTVAATYQFVDGTARLSFFIEPDKQGQWVIVERQDNPFSPKVKAKVFACAAFERVEPDRLRQPLIVIPDTAPRQPEQYLLHPLCSNGRDAKLW